MNVSNALASLGVADLSVSADWYERLLGPGRRPMPELVEWQFPGGGGLQVYVAPDRSGQGSCTVIVDDIDEVAGHLRTLGITDAEPVRNDTVDTLMIKDPDGNSIALRRTTERHAGPVSRRFSSSEQRGSGAAGQRTSSDSGVGRGSVDVPPVVDVAERLAFAAE